jgi:ribosomal protein L12E/L44/L45/RPP1/RPP2
MVYGVCVSESVAWHAKPAPVSAPGSEPEPEEGEEEVEVEEAEDIEEEEEGEEAEEEVAPTDCVLVC